MNCEKGKICVFGASSNRLDKAYTEAAHELGTLMAQRGWGCVNGGGAMGLMGAVSNGVMDAGGHVTGIIPKFMVDNGWCHSRLDDVVVTADMHQRKELMLQSSQAVIALPGGLGTLEELLEVLTWRQLGLVSLPVVLLNTNNFFSPLEQLFQQCVQQQFMKPSHCNLWALAPTPATALDIIERLLSDGLPPVETKN
ncbi:MAG: TIGR00730 family Rossman fold protein [Muribaculaceae bacterium]|nr:TIGR00730 family Rossman fold protein [Muribaculaceae bacterium]